MLTIGVPWRTSIPRPVVEAPSSLVRSFCAHVGLHHIFLQISTLFIQPGRDKEACARLGFQTCV